MSTIIARTAIRVIVPVAVLVSLYLLVRGHHAPGGGFIAALVAGAAIVLKRFADPSPREVGRFARATAAGLAVATVAAVVAMPLTGSFLGPEIWHFALPVVGEQKLTLSFVFDVGVYIAVISVIWSIVDEMEIGR